MKIILNKNHPAVRLGFKIGTYLRHKYSRKTLVKVIGYGDCLSIWGRYIDQRCVNQCPNAQVIIAIEGVNDGGWMETGYWCCQLYEDKECPWYAVNKKGE